MMTRTHFNVIADIVKDNYDPMDHRRIITENLLHDLCDFFKSQNRSFNSDKFWQRCGFPCRPISIEEAENN